MDSMVDWISCWRRSARVAARDPVPDLAAELVMVQGLLVGRLEAAPGDPGTRD